MQNEELNEFLITSKYCSGGQIKENEVSGTWVTNGERRGACRVLVGKIEEKRPL